MARANGVAGSASRATPRGSGGAWRAFSVFGIDILVQWSWLFIFTLVTWSLAAGYFPDAYPQWDDATRWLVGLATSLLFFGSVLVHELSHSLVARSRGIPVVSITLFVFGGVSSLGSEPRTARDEFVTAVVGPLASFALAALFGVVWLGARAAGVEPLQAMTGYLATINVSLGVFNLLPGFPLDGGRVLRSIVWLRGRNLITATRIAAYSGRVVAALMIGLGIATLLIGGGFGGLWFALIGWFLWNAATSSYQDTVLDQGLRGLTVESLVDYNVPEVPASQPLDIFLHDTVLATNRRAFLVMDEGNRLAGLVTLSDIRNIPKLAWTTTPVAAVMTPTDRLFVVDTRTELQAALRLMVEHDLNQLVVLEKGVPVGLVTRSTILSAVQRRLEVLSLSGQR